VLEFVNGFARALLWFDILHSYYFEVQLPLLYRLYWLENDLLITMNLFNACV
jgi:hypothetical protein